MRPRRCCTCCGWARRGCPAAGRSPGATGFRPPAGRVGAGERDGRWGGSDASGAEQGVAAGSVAVSSVASRLRRAAHLHCINLGVLPGVHLHRPHKAYVDAQAAVPPSAVKAQQRSERHGCPLRLGRLAVHTDLQRAITEQEGPRRCYVVSARCLNWPAAEPGTQGQHSRRHRGNWPGTGSHRCLASRRSPGREPAASGAPVTPLCPAPTRVPGQSVCRVATVVAAPVDPSSTKLSRSTSLQPVLWPSRARLHSQSRCVWYPSDL